MASNSATNGDVYFWIGNNAGLWNSPSNWADMATGAFPATAFPGTLTPVTIYGPTYATAGQNYLLVDGNGASYSLTVDYLVALGGSISTGTLTLGSDVAAGVLTLIAGATLTTTSVSLDNGTLALSGAAATLSDSGLIQGTGSVALTGGARLNAGLLSLSQGGLSVANSTAGLSGLSLGTVLTSGTAIAADPTLAITTGGTVTISGGAVVQNGAIQVQGSGARLTIQGALDLGPDILAGSTSSLVASSGGKIQIGSLQLQDSNPAGSLGDVPGLAVDASSSIEIGTLGSAALGAITIDSGASVFALTNADLAAPLVDNGLVDITGGTLTIAGASGSGQIQIGAGAALRTTGSIAASDSITFLGTAATLAIGAAGNGGSVAGMVAATLSGFYLGDSILLSGISATSASWQGGLLTVLNGTSTVVVLHLAGSYGANGFLVSPNSGAGSTILLINGGSTGGGSAASTSDAYGWVGGGGGAWGNAANWQDVTTGGNPAVTFPGTLTPVTIVGSSSSASASTLITGGGNAASVALTGQVGLTGSYGFGTLSVGSETTVTTNGATTTTTAQSGTLTLASGGSLATGGVSLISGSLGLTGASLTDSGNLTIGTPAGTYIFANGAFTGFAGSGGILSLGAGASLAVSGTADLANGALSISGASVSLASLTLGVAATNSFVVPNHYGTNGAVTVSNGGTLVVSGAITILDGSVAVSGNGSRLVDQGTLTLGPTGGAASGDNFAATGGGTIQLAGLLVQDSNFDDTYLAVPTISVDGASSIELGTLGGAARGALTIDAGQTLEVTSSANLSGLLVDNGLVDLSGGTLTLQNAVSGSGVLQISNGAVLVDDGALAGDAILFAGTGSLVLGTSGGVPVNVAGTIAGFFAGDSITLAGVAATGASFQAGVLTVMNGTHLVTTLNLAGSYGIASFVVTSVGGNSVISLSAGSTSFDSSSTSADAYDWIGGSGAWNVAANWQDITSGADPAVVFPGSLTAVTIAGPSGANAEIISGTAASASLAITGAVELDGAGTTGTLSIGTRNVSNGSVTLSAGTLALVAGDTLAASSVALADGQLNLTGADLTVSGGVVAGLAGGANLLSDGQYLAAAGASGFINVDNAAGLVVAGALSLAQGGISVYGGIASFASLSLGTAASNSASTPYNSAGTGNLSLSAGGSVTVSGGITEWLGAIAVAGTGSSLVDQGTLTLGPGAAYSAGGNLSASGGGTIQLAGLLVQDSNIGNSADYAPLIGVDAGSSIEIGFAGSAALGALTIDAGDLVTTTTSARLASQLVNNGILAINAGTLVLGGAVSGSGTLLIGTDADLQINGAVAAGETISFGGRLGTLAIGSATSVVAGVAVGAPYAIGGTILGLAVGDSLLFSGVAATSASYANGMLSVLNNGTLVTDLTLSGNYTSANFLVAPASSGSGTAITVLASATGGITGSASPVQPDFTGDGMPDLLLQSTADGTASIMLMNGNSVVSTTDIGSPGPGWYAVTTGDFNGDGLSDVVWQNNDGSVEIWEMDGTTTLASGLVATPGNNWHVMGSADFTGDGDSDLLLQADDGTVEIWEMNGTSIAATIIVGNPGTASHVVGIGDFAGNGVEDILLQNNTGAVSIWEMNGTTLVANAKVANPGSAWGVVGTGDFNGDGKTDILLQNGKGAVMMWEMNGTRIGTLKTIGTPPVGWHVVTTGDFNGDGKSDILLQDTAGDLETWQMNGTTITTTNVIGSVPVALQTVGQGPVHFINATTDNGTGTLAATILNDEFIFTSSLAGNHVITGFDPLHDMVLLSAAKFSSYGAVLARETNNDGSAMLNLGNGSTLTFENVLTSQLSARNFSHS